MDIILNDNNKPRSNYRKEFDELYENEIKRGNVTEAFQRAIYGAAAKTPSDILGRRNFYKNINYFITPY